MPTDRIILSSTASPFSSPDSQCKLTLAKVRSAYQRWAPIYNLLFGACFGPGQRRAVAVLASGPGERILEVGVGTGLALPYWHRDSQVTGIDISEGMLARAARLCARRKLRHVDLRLMDAQATNFPDSHFDKVAAMYVVSVVPNVPALFAEIRRICKPGGRIAIVNHFAHSHPLVGRFERLLVEHAALLGFNPALPPEAVTKLPGLRIHSVQRVNWGGYWTLLEAENVK